MNQGIPKVAVSLPMFSMKSQSVLALVRTLFSTPGVEFSLHVVEGAYIQSNRHQLALMALERKTDFMFFMDHDVVFQPDTLCRLIARDKDICFGKYSNRHTTTQRSLVTGLDGKLINDFPADLFECAIGPTGCMLIKMSVFSKIQQPWFNVILGTDGKVAESEDAWFCGQARNAGISVWCDPTIKVDHYGEAIY